MRFNAAGLSLLKSFEKCRLAAYQDPGGVWTIGYGHTEDVKDGDVWTQEQAKATLTYDVEQRAEGIYDSIHAVITDNQFSALVCLTFNIGCHAFKESTLLKKLNANDIDGVCKEFLRWVKVKGVPCDGLMSRRKAEQELFLR